MLRGLSNPDTNSANFLITCLNIRGLASKDVQIFIYSFLYSYGDGVTYKIWIFPYTFGFWLAAFLALFLGEGRESVHQGSPGGTFLMRPAQGHIACCQVGPP